MKNIVVVLLLLFFPTLIFSQSISGKVVDEKGVALIGVNIVNTTSSSSSVTDLEGAFKLKANLGDNLKVSMIGFATKNVKATSVMNIVLSEEANVLSDVTIIGYGTRKKVDNTSVVASLKSEDVNKTKVLNASQAIQGKLAGVQITASDSPGSVPSVVVRGLGTVLGGRTPLFVVDGMFVDNINNINSNDILSFDILKDASALAVYGNRAANGVVLITTKKGKSGKMSIDIDSYMGIRNALKTVSMADSNQFARYTNAALGTNTFSTNQPVNTNWYKEITRTGVYNSNNINISGSTESIKYLFSVNSYDEKAILNGLDYKRFTFRNNNEVKISSKITLAQNFNVSYTNSSPKPMSAFTNAYKQSSIVPVYFSNGQYGVSWVNSAGVADVSGSSFNNVGNPVAQLNYYNEHQKNVNMLGNLKLDIDVLKGLKFTSTFGAEYNTWKMYNYEDTYNIWESANNPGQLSTIVYPTAYTNLLTKSNSNYFNWNVSNYFTYNKVVGKHNFEVLAGIEANEKGPLETQTMVLKNVNTNENYWALNDEEYQSKVKSYTNTLSNKQRLASYFGRFQYKFNDKYLLTASVRRDGSSQFGNDYQWGTFPAVGLGWIVSKERFLSDIKGIDLVKIRGSWGKLGNQYVPLNIQTLASGLSYNFGGSQPSGTTSNKKIDPSLSWEVTEESSVGVDFELLDRRLKGSFDVYNKNVNNLILNTVPYVTSGLTEVTPAHVGKVSNKGYELSLRWDGKISQDINWWIGGNFASNKNRLVSLSNPSLSNVYGGSLGNGQYTKLLSGDAATSSVGQSLGSFFLYEYAGLDSSGNMLYYKADGTKVLQGSLSTADRKYVGSILPTSTYGFSLGMNYKNFDFSVDTYGTIGSKVYNGKKAQRFSGENVEASLATDYWSTSNSSSATPAPFNTVPVASTYYLESGDFFRINNITIGYKIPVKSGFISSARIYCNAINPFIHQKFSGYTPELNGDGDAYGSQGVELDAYPSLRSFVLGANLKF